ncbi:MAG: peptidase MA family metallohydrolase [Candidatus Omnitrophica bacterium]|nr:peptidase MA family metallohydrolase [Candidatus Omnitrophota bacterium]
MRRFKLFFIFLLLPLAVFADGQGWQVFKSTHFVVFYKDASENSLNELAQKAENCYNSITEDLGFNRFNFWTWDNRAKIYLFNNHEEYKKETHAADWSAGEANVASKTIMTFQTAPGFLDNILPHELAHIIFNEMVGFNNPAVPLWLQEGVAGYQQRDISSVKAYLANKLRQGNFISLDELSRTEVSGSRDRAKVELFYAESYSLVKYLISEFGRDRFVFFCQSLRDDKNLARALSKAYSFAGMEDFENAWKTYILE